MNNNHEDIQSDSKDEEIRELRSKLKNRDKTIDSLKEKLDSNKLMLQDILTQKNEVKKKIQEHELKMVDAKLNQYQQLQEKHQKTLHRLQVTKKHLDNSNIQNKKLLKKEEEMQRVIEDLLKRGLMDHLRNRYPESYLKYKGKIMP